MSFELGGRADKLGNDYENRYLVNLLLRMIHGEYESIEVEPLGSIDDGVEYTAVCPDQSKIFFQCKGSNAGQDSWRICDLNKYHIFDKAKRHLTAHSNNQYWFISPCKYGQLDELCHRARSNHSLADFKECQMNTDKMRDLFTKCREKFGCADDEQGETETLSLLARCNFVHYAFDDEAKMQLNDQIRFLFMGKADTNRIIIANLVNDMQYYGREITAAWLLNELQKREVIRYSSVSNSTWKTVDEINRIFYSSYLPMNGKLLERTATNELLARINAGESMILLGKPGAGKSGVLCSLMEHLYSQNIPHLAVKLNKDISQSTCDEFGKAIGLPFSPVECLRQLAVGQTAVLILDQLDSLRWSENHSARAFVICKELIRQAEMINRIEHGKISIVFACRLFDLEIDPTLRTLFCDTQKIRWEKLTVELLTEAEVFSVIGSSYKRLPFRLKTMLRTPATLSVWLHLSEEAHINVDSISSADQLIEAWWQDILNKGLCPAETLTKCIEEMIGFMHTHGLQYIPCQAMQKHNNAIKVLLSEQILVRSGNVYQFVHQSYFDFFLVSEALMEAYDGKSALDFLPPYEAQTPGERYRLLVLLQRFLNTDENIFLRCANELLKSNQVRYFYQCVVFEVVGQIEHPTVGLLQFVKEYYSAEKWQKYIIHVVLMRHPAFIRHIDELINDDWLDELHLDLLRSIVSLDSEFVLSKLEPYAGKTTETDEKLWRVFNIDIAELSEVANRFVLKLTHSNPQFLQTAWWIANMIKQESPYSVDYLLILLQHCEDTDYQNIYLGDSESIHWSTENYHLMLLEKLLPALVAKTCGWKASAHRAFRIYYEHEEWIKDYNRTIVSRAIVDLLIAAAQKCACATPAYYISLLNEYGCKDSYVVNEILMEGILHLPLDYGEAAFEWIFADFDQRIFVYTGNQSDYLEVFKKILKRFGATLTKETQVKLENVVYSWHEPVDSMRATLEARQNRNHEYGMVFCSPPYWGHLQYELLPLLPNRTMRSEKLLQSLRRNAAMYDATRFMGSVIGPAKSVASPIHGRAGRLSDAAWLRLMTSELQPNHRWRESRDGQCYIESNHQNFASAMENIVVLQPTRFIKLALQMPDNCNKCYVRSVFYGLARSQITDMDLSLVFSLLKKYATVSNDGMTQSILSLMDKLCETEWPSFIDAYLCNVALTHPKNEKRRIAQMQTTNDDHDLMTTALNISNGYAMYIINNRLFQKPDSLPVYKPVIESTMKHEHLYMRYIAAQCIVAGFNHEEDWAIRRLKDMIQKEPGILVSRKVRQAVMYDYANDEKRYRQIIVGACQSTNAALATDIAGFVCALAYYHKDDQLRNLLFSYPWTQKQIERICGQAMHFFSVPAEHDYAVDLFMQRPVWFGEARWLGIFKDKLIDLKRDALLIQTVLEHNSSNHLAEAFIDFANDTDEDDDVLATCICIICSRIDSYIQDQRRIYNLDDLLHVLLRLCDHCKGQPAVVDTCLTAMDKLFQSDCMQMHNLSARIDEETYH